MGDAENQSSPPLKTSTVADDSGTLESLGVSVVPVADVERNVVSSAERRAVELDAAEFEERDKTLLSEIGEAQQKLAILEKQLSSLRGPRRIPIAKDVRALHARIQALEQKRSSAREAHIARVEIGQRLDGSSHDRAAQTTSGIDEPDRTDEPDRSQSSTAKLGPTQKPGESDREFQIRIGKVNPFQATDDGPGFERRTTRRTRRIDEPPQKRARAGQASSRSSPGAACSDAGSNDSDESDDDASDDYAPSSGAGSDDYERLVDETSHRSTSASKRRRGAGKIEEVEEVVLKGGLVIPASLFDRVFDYQKTGIQWLWELHSQQCGGILADEMGLGKTVQVIAFLAALEYSGKLPGPVLIVAPATVLKQWANEFQNWAPRFQVRILHHAATAFDAAGQSNRKRSGSNGSQNPRAVVEAVTNAKTPSVMITSYEQVRKNHEYMVEAFEYVILDEGHKIRNPDAEVTLACKRFHTPRRLLVTGTPLQNNLRELWSLFDFVFPGRLGTLVVFESQFSAPIALGGYSNASRAQVHTAFKCSVMLRDLVAPYMLRRMKKDVALQLPDKQEHVLFCRLTDEQRAVYKTFLGSRTVKQAIAGRLNLLFAVTVLRKICNHPDIATRSQEWLMPGMSGTQGRRGAASRGERLHARSEGASKRTDENRHIDNGDEEDDLDQAAESDPEFGHWELSGKMKVLHTVLLAWRQAGSRALVFSQTRTMLSILERFARDHDYPYRRMDGQTPIGARMHLIDEFNANEGIFLFLLTTKVGGLGVNLTGADRVLLFDPDWNPSTDLQARERAWRIGQTKSVTVYRLITSGTIEEKIYHRQIYKQFLTNKILSDPRQRRFFKRKDIKDLFTLGDDQEAGTETGDLFAGTGASEVFGTQHDRADRADDGASDEILPDASGGGAGGDTALLKQLFDNADEHGLQSSIDHDAVIQAGQTTQDADVIVYEAEKVAARAVQEVQRSGRERQRDNVNVPTWTGRSGAAGVPRPRLGSSSGSESRSAMLLKKLKGGHDGALPTQADSPRVSTLEGADLMQEIITFLRQRAGVASTEAIIDHFDSRVSKEESGFPIFRAMLKKVAVLKKSVESARPSQWVLRDKFRTAMSDSD